MPLTADAEYEYEAKAKDIVLSPLLFWKQLLMERSFLPAQLKQNHYLCCLYKRNYIVSWRKLYISRRQKTALLAELETYKKSFIYECVTGKKEV